MLQKVGEQEIIYFRWTGILKSCAPGDEVASTEFGVWIHKVYHRHLPQPRVRVDRTRSKWAVLDGLVVVRVWKENCITTLGVKASGSGMVNWKYILSQSFVHLLVYLQARCLVTLHLPIREACEPRGEITNKTQFSITLTVFYGPLCNAIIFWRSVDTYRIINVTPIWNYLSRQQ